MVSNPSLINPFHIPPFYFFNLVSVLLLRLHLSRTSHKQVLSFTLTHHATWPIHLTLLHLTSLIKRSPRALPTTKMLRPDHVLFTRESTVPLPSSPRITFQLTLPYTLQCYKADEYAWHKSETSLACYKVPVKQDAAMPTETLVPLCYFVPNIEKLQYTITPTHTLLL